MVIFSVCVRNSIAQALFCCFTSWEYHGGDQFCSKMCAKVNGRTTAGTGSEAKWCVKG